MVGDGIRADFTVTDSGEDAGHERRRRGAGRARRAPVRRVRARTRPSSCSPRPRSSSRCTRPARTTRPGRCTPTRAMHWERSSRSPSRSATWTPRLDLREADLERARSGPAGTGIEKDLWPPANGYTPLTPARARGLRRRPGRRHRGACDSGRRTLTFTADQIGNGAKELLDEVATGKVTGEEENWSHTDLWDFQANVDGARSRLRGPEAAARRRRTPRWPTLPDTKFADLQTLLDQYSEGDGFVSYDELDPSRSRSCPTPSTPSASRCRSSPQRSSSSHAPSKANLTGGT